MLKPEDVRESVERLKVHLLSLDSAAMPTKCEVFAICGRPAREMYDDITAILSQLSSAQTRIEELGWLYVSDDGIEWSADHPVDSGQVPDARLIRAATAAELLSELKAAWEAHQEAIVSEARHSRLHDEERFRTNAAEAENARLLTALLAIVDLKPEPIGETGFVVGPASLLRRAHEIALNAVRPLRSARSRAALHPEKDRP